MDLNHSVNASQTSRLFSTATDALPETANAILLPAARSQEQRNRAIETILLVDDEEITLRILELQLTNAGFHVISAENGHEALGILSKSKPDLVLMDISMPVLDGYTTLQMMRQLHNSTELPIIMMTATINDETIVKCFDSGASDYLAKPIQEASMLARIDSQIKFMRTLSALRESEQRYVLASAGTRDGIWDWNLDTGQIYLSPRWRSLVGISESEIIGHGSSWLDLVFHEDQERVRTDLEAHLCGHTRHFETELRMPDESGGFRWMLCRGLAVRDEEGIPTRIAGSLTDVTEGKVADGLTGLPNRMLFRDRVERCVVRFQRDHESRFAVLYMDVNDFKLINDSMGHDVGDQFLIQMAQRLQSGLRRGDAVLSRLGGDEFAILVEGINDSRSAMAVAERIQQHVRAPFSVNGREIFGRISIGVAIISTQNASVDGIIREADTAMYHAKQFTENGISFFEEQMQQESATRLEIATELKDAIRRDEMSLAYQPIINAKTMQTAGFEALVRWTHPNLGQISPSEFIPIAESTGLIVDLGNWILEEACRQAVVWNQHSTRELQVSVNVSMRQFRNPSFLEQVQSILQKTGLPPHKLKLEVTESLLMQKPEEVVKLLENLQATGVLTSIDDFGTGYSSLSYLHRMPLNVLKIDRSFVENLSDSKKHQAIVRSIIGLARNLNLKVIAEGIETARQADHLQGLQCEYFQGFYYSCPVTAQETLPMIEYDWSQVK